MKKNVFRAFGLALVAMLAFIGCAGTVPRPPSAAGTSEPQPIDTSRLTPNQLQTDEQGRRWLYVRGGVRITRDIEQWFIPKNENPMRGIIRNLDLGARLDIYIFRIHPDGRREFFLGLVLDRGLALKTTFPQGDYTMLIFAWRERLGPPRPLGKRTVSFNVGDDPTRFLWPPEAREGVEYVGWFVDLSGFSDPSLTAATSGRLSFTGVLDASKLGADIAEWLRRLIYGY